MKTLLTVATAIALAFPAVGEENARDEREKDEPTGHFMNARTTGDDSKAVSGERYDVRTKHPVPNATISAPAGQEKNTWPDRLELTFEATYLLQTSYGADQTLSPEGDITDASFSFDFGITATVTDHDIVFAYIEAGNGDGLDGDIPTLSGFNADADNDTELHLTELWYEGRFLNDRLALKTGKIDLGGPCGKHENAFDANAIANDECHQFLSGGFVNNLAVEFPADNGFGMSLWTTTRGEQVDFGIAIADADADWENVFNDTFLILQIDFKPTIHNRQGNYRIFGWRNNTAHTDLTNSSKTHEAGKGFGLSFDQELTNALTVFIRYSRQEPHIYQIGYAFSAGIQISGECCGRKNDIIGLAYGIAAISDEWERIDKINGINSGNECHAEMYWNIALNSAVRILPDIQWIRNPNGDADNPDVWAFGLRSQMTF